MVTTFHNLGLTFCKNYQIIVVKDEGLSYNKQCLNSTIKKVLKGIA